MVCRRGFSPPRSNALKDVPPNCCQIAAAAVSHRASGARGRHAGTRSSRRILEHDSTCAPVRALLARWEGWRTNSSMFARCVGTKLLTLPDLRRYLPRRHGPARRAAVTRRTIGAGGTWFNAAALPHTCVALALDCQCTKTRCWRQHAHKSVVFPALSSPARKQHTADMRRQGSEGWASAWRASCTRAPPLEGGAARCPGWSRVDAPRIRILASLPPKPRLLRRLYTQLTRNMACPFPTPRAAPG